MDYPRRNVVTPRRSYLLKTVDYDEVKSCGYNRWFNQVLWCALNQLTFNVCYGSPLPYANRIPWCYHNYYIIDSKIRNILALSEGHGNSHRLAAPDSEPLSQIRHYLMAMMTDGGDMRYDTYVWGQGCAFRLGHKQNKNKDSNLV